ncbi:MAG: hypothetical protein IJV35_05780 [Neisseriaceae bacterium]|nr:hypothetical protein [Neisseriaceae bacterium]
MCSFICFRQPEKYKVRIINGLGVGFIKIEVFNNGDLKNFSGSLNLILRVIASRNKVSAWQSNELRSNSSTPQGVVTVVSVIISGSLKLLMNLVVTTPVALVKNLRFFTGLPRQAFRLGS